MNNRPAEKTPIQLTRNERASLLRYRLMLLVLFPVLVGYTLVQAVKHRSFRYFAQRLGMNYGDTASVDIWIHAASVGEVNATIPLIHAIHKKYPNTVIMLTTTTPTGARVVQSKHLTNVYHRYLPLDYALCVSALLNHARPRCLIVMETEIWPNLYRLCHANNIALYTVNGRLSPRTLNTRHWIRSLYTLTLKYSTLILTRSDNDSKAYIALGADSEKVKTVGNIKFAMQFVAPEKQHLLGSRPYLLAASTHDDEELQIATLWTNHREQLAGYLLVIAPRHPHRLGKILNQLRPLQLSIAVRSRNQPVTEQTQVYIVDTLGELVTFMNGAQLVFMGGSLVPVGGHNVIEPANLARAIVFGPHMENFVSEAQLLLNHQAAIQVENTDDLLQTVRELLYDKEKCTQLGNKARTLVEAQKDIADRYVNELSHCLEK